MINASKKTLSAVALISGLAAATWSPASLACSGDSPVLGSVCIMATPATYGSFNQSFVVAAGQQLSVSQYTALFSLIGTTYGGNGQTTFNLPDLRGRVVLGADTSGTYPAGKTGGAANITLSTAQLPPHYLVIPPLPIDLSKITAATTLSGLAATANLAGVTISGPASGLVIKASSTGGGQGTPNNNYLGKPSSASANFYTTSTPDVSLNSGSISGNLSLTIPTGTTAPVTISGGASTVLGGTATTNAGTTSAIGSGTAIPILPPYLAMTYYIATNGLYPVRN